MQNKPEYTRFLPHYHPVGATFFVTFRLHGSLPQSFLVALSAWYYAELDLISKEVPVDRQKKAVHLLQRDYFRKLDHVLDQCLYGPDFLKEPLAALRLTEQLNRFDGTYYRLLAYTILPNHAHVLMDLSVQLDESGVQPAAYKNLDFIMRRVKGASARYINLALGRTGEPCWQEEYNDRYIRDRRHLLAAVDYIKQNPVNAQVCRHWREHAFTWVHEEFW